MIVYLVHGFNVRDGGKRTVDRFRPLLEERGYQVRDVDYGRFGLGKVRLCNKGVSRLLARLVEPDSIAIAHSNGAAVVRQAAVYGAHFQHVTLVNPALDRAATIPYARTVDVWHAPSDVATLASRLLLFHPWGSQGRHGFKGLDRRYRNFNADDLLGEELKHSGIFRRRRYLTAVLDQIP